MRTVQNIIRWLLASISVLVLVGCASGPTFTQLQSSTPAVSSDKGRIYIYRSSPLGAAIQPSILLDGEVVGSAVPLGYFYVDRTAGSYKISTSTEVDRTVSFTLAAGQTRYVRIEPSFGFFVGHLSPVLVEEPQGKDEIKDLHFIGK